VHLNLLLLSQLYLSVLCFCYTLCFCAPCPFYAPFLFCAFQLLHSVSFYTPQSLSTPPISSLFCILIVSVHLVHPYPRCFCMLYTPCRVLYLIIIATLQLLLVVKPMCPSSLGVMPRFLSLSIVETLHLLCHSRAHPLCCSYRLQCSSICQSPL
jgi:hypothetical protein